MAKATDVLVFWFACLLLLGPARVAAGLYNLSLTADGPATVGTEVTISASLEVKDNGSLPLPADTHLYRFHWIHTPLTLTAKNEKNLTSTIHVVGGVPGDFPISVWVTAVDCWVCQPLARSTLLLPIKESLVGNIVVTQNTSLSWPNSYITKRSLRLSFLLHDPSDFFKSASFFYRWDFGDGTLLITDNPVVYYNYSSPGTFTVKVRVVAEWEQIKPDTTKGTIQKTGDFSASLDLRESLQGIQILGPTLLQTFQKLTMNLNFFGSPPLHVCWGLKPQCLPLEDRECHAVLVTRTSFNLTHVFQDPGDYCFIFRAENAISKAHQYHRIQVWPSTPPPTPPVPSPALCQLQHQHQTPPGSSLTLYQSRLPAICLCFPVCHANHRAAGFSHVYDCAERCNPEGHRGEPRGHWAQVLLPGVLWIPLSGLPV